jgi:hypothetical protein
MPERATNPGGGRCIEVPEFRTLVGTVSNTTDPITAPKNYSYMLRWASNQAKRRDKMVIFPKFLKEEKSTLRQLVMFENLRY